jgi:hypothetical protein
MGVLAKAHFPSAKNTRRDRCGNKNRHYENEYHRANFEHHPCWMRL